MKAKATTLVIIACLLILGGMVYEYIARDDIELITPDGVVHRYNNCRVKHPDKIHPRYRIDCT